MLDSPLELLSGHQDLAEYGVDASLARIETCGSNDGVLVVQEESTGSVSISIDQNLVGGSISSFDMLNPSLGMPAREHANATAIPKMHLLQETLQDLSTLGERRLCPFFLCFAGLCNDSINAVRRNRVDNAQRFRCCRAVALDGCAARYLEGCSLAQEPQ
jgi:hypothetical protein